MWLYGSEGPPLKYYPPPKRAEQGFGVPAEGKAKGERIEPEEEGVESEIERARRTS